LLPNVDAIFHTMVLVRMCCVPLLHLVLVHDSMYAIAPYMLSPVRPSIRLLVRERSALTDPYCHSAWMSVCVSVRNFEVKYLGNQRS